MGSNPILSISQDSPGFLGICFLFPNVFFEKKLRQWFEITNFILFRGGTYFFSRFFGKYWNWKIYFVPFGFPENLPRWCLLVSWVPRYASNTLDDLNYIPFNPQNKTVTLPIAIQFLKIVLLLQDCIISLSQAFSLSADVVFVVNGTIRIIFQFTEYICIILNLTCLKRKSIFQTFTIGFHLNFHWYFQHQKWAENVSHWFAFKVFLSSRHGSGSTDTSWAGNGMV